MKFLEWFKGPLLLELPLLYKIGFSNEGSLGYSADTTPDLGAIILSLQTEASATKPGWLCVSPQGEITHNSALWNALESGQVPWGGLVSGNPAEPWNHYLISLPAVSTGSMTQARYFIYEGLVE